LKPEEACKKLGCEETMYCFGGKNKTVNPPLCPEAEDLLKESEKK